VRIALALSLLLAACNNSPYPDGAAATNTIFNSFDERSPRYLDPTASYSNPETPYTYSAYEPMYAYHYLKRPYELIPKTAEAVAKPHYVDKAGQPLPDDAPPEQIAESIYDVHLKKGILYAPHPAFAKNDKGEYLYHHLTREQVGDKRSPWDFEKQGTRELVAEDYVYAFKRHATTLVQHLRNLGTTDISHLSTNMCPAIAATCSSRGWRGPAGPSSRRRRRCSCGRRSRRPTRR